MNHVGASSSEAASPAAPIHLTLLPRGGSGAVRGCRWRHRRIRRLTEEAGAHQPAELTKAPRSVSYAQRGGRAREPERARVRFSRVYLTESLKTIRFLSCPGLWGGVAG